MGIYVCVCIERETQFQPIHKCFFFILIAHSTDKELLSVCPCAPTGLSLTYQYCRLTWRDGNFQKVKSQFKQLKLMSNGMV